MSEIEIVGLAGGSLALVALLVAAYLNGHHNGRNLHQIQEAARPQSKDKLDPSFVLEVMEDGVVMVDSQGVIRLFNPAAQRITGWSASEVVGLDFHSVLSLVNEHSQAYQPADHPFSKVLQTNQPAHDSKAVLTTRNGKQVPISLIVSPVSTTGQSGAVGVFRDITREKAEESERAEFISTASHEMRTPIASIEGYLSLVLNNKTGKIDANSRTYLTKAHTATQHLGQLFQDLLTTTRAEDSRLASKLQAVDVSAVIADTIEQTKQSADKKNLGLHYLASGETPSSGKVIKPLFFVKADPDRLKEVLQNLLDNAIKYTNAGSVTVKLTGDDSVVQIQISDTGSGIPAEDVPHLFQKFYRVDNSMTREVGGTGLGLFICRKILELYDGRIWVESRVGKGSTFFVNLPRLKNTGVNSSQTTPVVIQSQAS